MKKGISDTSINILLIEDKPADVLLIKRMLSTVMNFTIEQVARLSAGLECLAKGGIDVILMDIVLPDGDGILSIKKICTMFPGVPLVVLTGFPDEEMGIRSIHEGAQDYLVKGLINADALRRILRYSIERKKTGKKLERLSSLESFRLLSGNVAQECNVLFTEILELIAAAKKSVSSGDTVFSMLSDVECACNKAKHLNNQLIALANEKESSGEEQTRRE